MLRVIYTQDETVTKEFEANDCFAAYEGFYPMVAPYNSDYFPLPQTNYNANTLPQTSLTGENYLEYLIVLRASATTQAVFAPSAVRNSAATNGPDPNTDPADITNWSPLAFFKTADNTYYSIYCNGAEVMGTSAGTIEPAATFIQNPFPNTSLFCYIKGQDS